MSPSLRTAYSTVDLPFVDAEARERWRKQLDIEDVYLQRHAALMEAAIARDGRLPAAQPDPVQVWQFADGLTLVALGGEVVVDYALRLAKEYPQRRMWVAGYSNDVFGYVPSARVRREGGYEGGDAMIYYGRPAPFTERVEEIIVAEVQSWSDSPGCAARRFGSRTMSWGHWGARQVKKVTRRKFLGTVVAGGALAGARPDDFERSRRLVRAHRRSRAAWRNAGAAHTFPGMAGCRRTRGGRARRLDSQRQVVQRQERRGVRGFLCLADRREALPGHGQRDERADHLARRAGHRARATRSSSRPTRSWRR